MNTQKGSILQCIFYRFFNDDNDAFNNNFDAFNKIKTIDIITQIKHKKNWNPRKCTDTLHPSHFHSPSRIRKFPMATPPLPLRSRRLALLAMKSAMVSRSDALVARDLTHPVQVVHLRLLLGAFRDIIILFFRHRRGVKGVDAHATVWDWRSTSFFFWCLFSIVMVDICMLVQFC